MPDPLQPLILDLLDSIAAQPRPYREVMDAWRTSCPRLPVWEDAIERDLLEVRANADGVLIVSLTALGRAFLTEHRATTQPAAR